MILLICKSCCVVSKMIENTSRLCEGFFLFSSSLLPLLFPKIGQEWLLDRLIVDINRTGMIRLTFIMFFSAVVDLRNQGKER